MVLERESILIALNRIRDNIWLGDLSEVQRIAEGILGDEDSKKLSKEADEAHKLVLKIRKQARNQEKKSKGWLADKMQGEFSENQVSSINYVLGTVVKRLDWVSDKVKTAEEKKEVPVIVRRKNYRFRVIAKPPKYEVRTLVTRRFKTPNEDELKLLAKKLESEDFSIDKGKSSLVIRFFSKDEFVEAVILPYTAEMNMVERVRKEGRVEAVADSILATVIGP
jgi:hypothetical protein